MRFLGKTAKFNRVSTARLDAMCKAAHSAMVQEDCIRRLENKKLVNDLKLARIRYVLGAWLG